VASRLIGLVRGLALVWLMVDKSEFGLLQIALMAVNVLNPLCSVGLNEAVTRYVPQYETRHTLRAFLRRAVPFVLVAAAGLCLSVFLAAGPLGRFFFAALPADGAAAVSDARAAALTRMVAATTFAVIAYYLLQAVLRGLRMYRVVSVMELVNGTGFTLLAILVVIAGWNTVGAVLVAYAVTVAVGGALFVLPLIRVLRQRYDQAAATERDVARTATSAAVAQLLRFSSWGALGTVMWQTLQYYPMWYLQKIHGPEATAVFGSVRLVGQAVLFAAVAITAVVQTAVTRTWESQGQPEADRKLLLAIKATALLLTVGCAALATMKDVVIRVLPAGYSDGAGIIPALLLFFLLGGHLSLLSVHFVLIERTRYVFWPWALGVACSVLFGLRMVRMGQGPTEALSAAAWSGVFAVSAAMVLCLVLVHLSRRPLDAGVYALLMLSFALALPAQLLCVLVVAALLLAVGTNLIFTPAEKQELRAQARALRRRVTRFS
jgi:O-antigen/teichoic acid export membrane protein